MLELQLAAPNQQKHRFLLSQQHTTAISKTPETRGDHAPGPKPTSLGNHRSLEPELWQGLQEGSDFGRSLSDFR